MLEKVKKVSAYDSDARALLALTAAAHPFQGRVIYVSRNPSSFAKDAGHLIKAGYHISFLQGLDQFLWSNHVELIAAFERQ